MKVKGLFASKKNEKTSSVAAVLNLFIVCLLLATPFGISLKAINVILDFSFVVDYGVRLLDGFLITAKLSVVSLLLSLLIGIVSAAGQEPGILFIKYLCDVYVKFIRRTPLIMQIYLFFYTTGTVWGVQNRFVTGALVLSTLEGAYIAEITRDSLLPIEDSQLEATKAVGFIESQIVWYVLLPQLIARILLALTGRFAPIVEGPSLLSVIAVIELTQTVREVSTTNSKLFECYLALGLLYLCPTLPISLISSKLGQRSQYENWIA